MRFRDRHGHTVDIRFAKRKRRNSADLFWLCTSIAVLQHHHTKTSRVTRWRGAGDSLFKRGRLLFGKELLGSTVNQYWLHFAKGQEDVERKYTEFQIDGVDPLAQKSREQQCADIITTYGHEFFGTGAGYVLGPREEVEKGEHKLYKIEFEERDNEFTRLENLIYVWVIVPDLDNRVRPTGFAGIIDRLEGSGYELPDLLTDEANSVFAAGQNLHTLLGAAGSMSGHSDQKVKSYKEHITKWLCDKKHRRFEILIMDPKSKEDVLSWARTHGREFILDLCEAIEKYCSWCRDMEEIGFSARVTSRVPLSFTAVNVDIADPEAGRLVIVPPLLQKDPKERTAIILDRRADRSAFDSYYKPYHGLFLSKSESRDIRSVSGKELAICRSWTKELHEKKPKQVN